MMLSHSFCERKHLEVRKKGDTYVKAINIVYPFLGCFFSLTLPLLLPFFLQSLKKEVLTESQF